ncbi:MAG: cell division protein SepF [Candidatus Obscuribacterales bacterium]|nr:cell division protein SepF [Candidatus Obscuribacterales bacterium]
MSQESKEPNQEKPTPSSANKPAKREIELFPPIAERNMQALPAVPTTGGRLGTQISMFQPGTFEEALDIVEALRSRHATTISLEKLRKIDANRLVDFVSGASAALDGDFHKMTEQVFVFCPANIKIVSGQEVPATSEYKMDAGVDSESFSLDALFPEIGQDKFGLSSLWTRQ